MSAPLSGSRALKTLYRRAFRHIKYLPKEKQATTLKELRTSFRVIPDKGNIELKDIVKDVENRIGYIKMTTPKHFLPKSLKNSDGKYEFYVDNKGNLVNGRAPSVGKVSNYGNTQMNRDDYNKFKGQMDRLQFQGGCGGCSERTCEGF